MTTEYPMVDVLKVKPLEAFRLWVRFSDGSEGVADLSRLAARTGPMVAPLKDPAFFGRVFVDRFLFRQRLGLVLCLLLGLVLLQRLGLVL